MAWAVGATALAISARCRFIASLLQAGRIKAAPLPSLGQTAPKMEVEAVRWPRGALGRVPRFAQRRVILFFWPDAGLIGEPNFYRVAVDALRARDRFQTRGEAFLKFS